MAAVGYLADASAMARSSQEEVGERLESLAEAGRLWTCRMVDLEMVYGSRAGHVAEVAVERRAMPEAPTTPAVMERALQVAALLAQSGLHRGAKPVDLVVAACAEAANLTVLHYDDGYDRISSVTGQPSQWVARRGTLDR